MKTGILIVTILIGILIIGALGYFAYSSINDSGAKTSSDNNVVGGGNNRLLNDIDRGGRAVQPKTYEVKISNFVFSPSTITINEGDTIKWTNLDSSVHTVTSNSGNELDSEYLSKTETYSNTFNVIGTYNYYCSLHPSMKAKVVVK